MSALVLRVESFDFGAAYSTGVKLIADGFPNVYVGDDGVVEWGEDRADRAAAAAWFRAVADYLGGAS